jgi:peptidoglycan/xylan/chitin deacetylase (PgdA/CDA1 family)
MILIYHNIIADRTVDHGYPGLGLPVSCFEQQLDWLARYRRIVSLSKYLEMKKHGKSFSRNLVALTFDDGLASTFERVYPLLQKQSVPATFFISTCHLRPGKLLWFSYLNALCFAGVYPKIQVANTPFELSSREQRVGSRCSLGAMARASGNPTAFCDELAATYPLPDSVTAEYKGMSSEQLSLLGKCELFEGGAHTVTHPFLDQLSRDEQEEEIVRSSRQLAKLTGRRVRYFAYPNGDYNRDTLGLMKGAGFDAAFATHRRRVGINDRFEIVRMGIYSTSFFKFWLKAQGVVTAAHRLGLATR